MKCMRTSAARGCRAIPMTTILEDGTNVYRLSESERTVVREGLESRVVSDEELQAFRSRHKA